MDLFLKCCGGVILSVILIQSMGSLTREMGLLLSICTCCLVALTMIGFLKPVVDLIHQLEHLGNLNGSMIGILMKAAGIGLICEIASLICNDAGNSSMGKTLQMFGSAVILWLSLPLFTSFLELLQQILGEL